MMHAAQIADDGRESKRTALRPKGPLISLIVLAIGVAGCAREPTHREFDLTQREVKAKRETKAAQIRLPMHARAKIKPAQHADLRVRRPDPALLSPQPAPNCEFKRSDVKAVDANEWTRLKAEYERQCYQDAEKAARDRLAQLQASIERAPQRRRAR